MGTKASTKNEGRPFPFDGSRLPAKLQHGHRSRTEFLTVTVRLPNGKFRSYLVPQDAPYRDGATKAAAEASLLRGRQSSRRKPAREVEDAADYQEYLKARRTKRYSFAQVAKELGHEA